MKRLIGSHYTNDRWNLYEFSRRSGLPYGYFEKWEHVGHVAVGVSMTVIATVLIVCAATGLFS